MAVEEITYGSRSGAAGLAALMAASLTAFLLAPSPGLALHDYCGSMSVVVVDERTNEVSCKPLPKATNSQQLRDRERLRQRQKIRNQRALNKQRRLKLKQRVSRQSFTVKQQQAKQNQISQQLKLLRKQQDLSRRQPPINRDQKRKYLQSSNRQPTAEDLAANRQGRIIDRRRDEIRQLQEVLSRQKRLQRRQKLWMERLQEEQLER